MKLFILAAAALLVLAACTRTVQCGNDATCFEERAAKCRKANITTSAWGEVGTFATTHSVLGKSGGQCEVSATAKTTITYPDAAPSTPFVAELLAAAKNVDGKQMTCVVPVGATTLDWKYYPSSCTGPLKEALDAYELADSGGRRLP
ncbi:hypothetical protein HY642_02865 [Candidatus Woesearchaeota archaeon]|nr:hypothetical protein [Candidatus Woesearchaeota archaeon]